ncbi:hypothetical protein [Bradyrhizobium sp. STM 3843]|uniref:hypothetical protein n=1 Tax=Bradyrhizobium sp. STM 3843 TaxID=551947 RepID=UPI001586BB4A|nr:hypothetical protein [Bradyrhizobium sp. STM 3843]
MMKGDELSLSLQFDEKSFDRFAVFAHRAASLNDLRKHGSCRHEEDGTPPPICCRIVLEMQVLGNQSVASESCAARDDTLLVSFLLRPYATEANRNSKCSQPSTADCGHLYQGSQLITRTFIIACSWLWHTRASRLAVICEQDIGIRRSGDLVNHERWFKRLR